MENGVILNIKYKNRLLLYIFLTIIPLFLNSNLVSAQSQLTDIEMSSVPAYSGNFKFGEWLPIWVTISNNGPDIEGVLEVEISQSGGNVTFARAVSLPAGSRKQITLSVLPNNFSRELEINLLSNQERILSNIVTVNPNQNDSILIGVSSHDRGGLSLIGNIDTGDSFRKVVLFDLKTQEIPGRAREMDSLDAIILNDTDTSQLIPEQKNVLEDWISNGGHLIIGGGPGLEKTILGLPDSIKNFTVGQITSIEQISNLEHFADDQSILIEGPFTISTIDSQAGSSLVNTGEIELLRQWGYGKGKISLSALDLSAAPFNAWSGTTAFWEKLLSSEINFPMWMPRDMSLRQMRANSMSYPLSNLPALDIPSIKALGILLILYILVIGPLNFLVLKWKSKLQLAWVTIPVLTVLFTGGAFGLAYTLRGNDVMINKLSIINLQQDGFADIDSYIGIFSPSQTEYEIQIDGDHLLSPSMGGYYDPWSSANFNSTGQTTFYQGNPSKVVGLNINQWSMQSFNVEAIRTKVGSIQSSLSIGRNEITGTLISKVPFVVEDAVLVAGQDTHVLGDIIPNQEIKVEFPISDQPLNIFGIPLTNQILEAVYPGSSFNYQREIETKRAVMDNHFQPFGYWLGPNLNDQAQGDPLNVVFPNLFILGWASESPLNIRLNDQEISQNSLSLVVTQIPLTIDKGDFTIPSSFLSGKIIEQPSNSGYCGSSATNLYMDYGTAKFEFSLPPVIYETQITNFSVYFNEDISQWSQEDPGFSVWIYNWDQDTWVQLPEITNGLNQISLPQGLLSQSGTIRIQVDKENKNSGGCVYLGLGLEGINQ